MFDATGVAETSVWVKGGASRAVGVSPEVRSKAKVCVHRDICLFFVGSPFFNPLGMLVESKMGRFV
jgi:hypothetical protein